MFQPLFLLKIWNTVTRAVLMVIIIVTLAVVAALVFSHPSGALSGKDFKAGNIIDDYTFYNSASMNVSQIQNFLNAKVPSCDTQGKLSAASFNRPDLTRAEYASLVGWHKPPYTCLRDYKQQNTPQMEAASGLCEAISAKTNRTAAQIIKDVADACHINPQVLLILLEKEQSLITDTWPLSRQYEKATGFACPDTAPCDSSYSGFFYQIYYAARQYQIYKAHPNDYNYLAGRTNRIYYNPNYSCGSSNVFIENQATAGLYNYTPYQPNASALNNLYGTGDSCGAYGNRNFWRLFTEWFGSTHGGIAVSAISFESQPFTNKQTFAKITIKNISKSSFNLGRLKIEARSNSNGYYQTPSVSDVTVKAGSTYTFRQPITITEEGSLTFSVARNVSNEWMNPPFKDFAIIDDTKKVVQVTAEPTIDQSLSLSGGTQHIGAPITATFRIKNNSSTQAVNVGRLKIQGYLNGIQYDFPSTPNNLSIPAGQTYTYNQQFTPVSTGTYTFRLMNNRDEYGWSDNYPTSASSSIVREVSVKVNDSVTIIEPLRLSKADTHQGEQVTATFKIKNFSNKSINIGRTKVEGKMGSSQFDFPSTPNNLTLQPGEVYEYNESAVFSKNGVYSFKLMNYRASHQWSENYPTSESSDLARTAILSVKDPATVIEGLKLNTSSSHTGETITATFKIKNFSNKSINIGRTKVEGKMGSSQFDFPSTPNNLTLQPGEVYEYNESLTLTKSGAYSFRLMNNRETLGWSDNYPISESSSITRNASIAVQEAVTIIQGLSFSANTTSTSSEITAIFTMKNFSSIPVNIGRMKVEGKMGSSQFDFPSTPNNLTLQPGEVYEYNESRTLPRLGIYTFKLVNYRSWAGGWSFDYPVTAAGNIPRAASITVQ